MSEILTIKDLSISFGGTKAVQHLSFNVNEGEILGMIGPNGSGKSTTINLITGVYKMDSGEIFFDGKPITNKMDVKDRARMGLGRTFQTPKPFGHMTVYDNILAIALQKYNFKEARVHTEEILKITELNSVRDLLGAKLPIEQRKWLDFARTLATEPKLVMMDEALSGLNITEMNESVEMIRRINKELNLTIIFIEHVMKAIVSLCDRVLVLNEGTWLAEGKPEEILAKSEVIQAYIGGE
ncbi:ABC transporter ATP-binding protein [uncultured Dysosmobacter sp.]|uniref:ABC transporter ATP-binding protein n=1 Tax=uncultured Dysosmobacter sp. TaxID=2591384 RepID=UPI002623AD75|nr:ABC transporter ATP-binding protein [uncultured Dysosmobacter sp.]